MYVKENNKDEKKKSTIDKLTINLTELAKNDDEILIGREDIIERTVGKVSNLLTPSHYIGVVKNWDKNKGILNLWQNNTANQENMNIPAEDLKRFRCFMSIISHSILWMTLLGMT